MHPQPETYYGNVNPFGPRSCYDEGKRVAESLCWAYKSHLRADIRIARILNVYGPRMSPLDGRVVSNFVDAALAGKQIEIAGDGHATRTFQYVSDCVEGLIRLMDSAYDEQPVNIGSDADEVSMADLATRICEIVKETRDEIGNSRPRFLRKRTNDPVQRKADISQARVLLDWYPVVSLEEGLRKTIAWSVEVKESVVGIEVTNGDRDCGAMSAREVTHRPSQASEPTPMS